MRLPCILTIAALLRASGQPRNATTAQARRRLQGGGVTAVVITVHNALASTIDCLEALVATARGSVRLKVVWVLDNCDGPTTASLTTWSRRRGRQDDVVVLTNHSSYSLAANEGLRAALHAEDVDAVALLNSDTVPSTGWLHGLRRVLFSPPTDDDLADAFAAADVDEDEMVTATELANYRLHPGEDAEHFERLKPYDKNGDGALTWPEVCPEATDVPVRGCDDRDWACAKRDADDDVAGLLPPRLAAVGALSNAASYQTVPWPTPRNRRERRAVRGWNVVALPAGWTPETAARAARLGATGRRADAGLLNGFCMLLSRDAIDAVGLLDEATYPGGYGEENDWAVRARRAGWGLAVVPGVHLFHAKTQSYSIERRQELKLIARENSRAKWSHGEVGLAELLLKRSPHHHWLGTSPSSSTRAGAPGPGGAGRRPCISRGRRAAATGSRTRRPCGATRGCLCGPASSAPSTWTRAPITSWRRSSTTSSRRGPRARRRPRPSTGATRTSCTSTGRGSGRPYSTCTRRAWRRPRLLEEGPPPPPPRRRWTSRRCTIWPTPDRCVFCSKFSWFGVTRAAPEEGRGTSSA